LGAAELAGLRRYQVVQLDTYLGTPLQFQPDYVTTIAEMAATAAPNTVFLLDTRIDLPGMSKENEIEEHMLRLRNIAPSSWGRTSERDLPSSFAEDVAPEALPAPAKEGP
jgi:hypothetical protein